jgi:hypothetical protein
MLLLFAGCETGRQQEVARRTIRSWSATSVMVADAWLRGIVPDAYASQVLRTAEQALSRTPRSNMRGDAGGSMCEITELRQGVESRDPRRVARALAALESVMAREGRAA